MFVQGVWKDICLRLHAVFMFYYELQSIMGENATAALSQTTDVGLHGVW